MDRYLRHPSRPARWNGTELVPIQLASPAEVEVWAGWAEDDTKVWEALIATPIDGEDAVEIRSIPAYAYGLNYGDAVECVASAEGPLVISRVARFGGQATFRIWLGRDADPSAWRLIAETYAKRGCVVDVLTTGLIALSCVAEDAEAIQHTLNEDSTRTGLVWEPGTPTT